MAFNLAYLILHDTMKIVILRESKLPFDRRTALTPYQLKELSEQYPEHEFYVQKSHIRTFTDKEYSKLGIPLIEDCSICDILIGVKEVDRKLLIPEKIYLFFSHTAKLQSHNQTLLQEASRKKITLIDYEYLAKNEERVVAFGYWAGIVGTYKAMLGLGLQTSGFRLKPSGQCIDLHGMKKELTKVRFAKSKKFVVTGEGRVASGAVEILEAAGIKRVSPESYLNNDFNETVYCQIGPQHYTKHRDGLAFDFNEFVNNPQNFDSAFYPYAVVSEVFIACHFWDPRSPVFFTTGQMGNNDFRIRFIADISCDMNGPIPATIKASTLENPFYGISRINGNEIDPFTDDEITVMAVDNLPGGIPRDASKDFGDRLLKHVIPELLGNKSSEIIENATILKNGELTPHFAYLEDYLSGKLGLKE